MQFTYYLFVHYDGIFRKRKTLSRRAFFLFFLGDLGPVKVDVCTSFMVFTTGNRKKQEHFAYRQGLGLLALSLEQ